MNKPLKRYVYISDVKVNMLYSQISMNALEQIAEGLSINLKLPIVEVNKDFSAKGEKGISRYDKLKIVIDYLEKHSHSSIGTIDNPGEYIKGVLPMHWCYIPPSPRIKKLTYFGGSTEHTILGLGGSIKHLIEKAEGTVYGEPSSDLPTLVSYLIAESGPNPQHLEDDDEYSLSAVQAMEKSMKGIKTNFEFVAWHLLDSSMVSMNTSPKRIVLGSPLFVAYANKGSIGEAQS